MEKVWVGDVDGVGEIDDDDDCGDDDDDYGVLDRHTELWCDDLPSISALLTTRVSGRAIQLSVSLYGHELMVHQAVHYYLSFYKAINWLLIGD
jgi:hypothetical protein